MNTLICDQYLYRCDQKQYYELNDDEQDLVHTHLQDCPSCREYSERNQKLSGMIATAKIQRLSKSQKDILKSQIKEAWQNIT